MDPVYAVVKAGSTPYCGLFLGQAQDIEVGAERRGLLLIALFCTGFEPACAFGPGEVSPRRFPQR
jgi:hypothetical protein